MYGFDKSTHSHKITTLIKYTLDKGLEGRWLGLGIVMDSMVVIFDDLL